MTDLSLPIQVIMDNQKKAEGEGEDYAWERVIERIAEQKNCWIQRPKENELFLDFDTEEQWIGLDEKICDLIKDKDCPHSVTVWASQSGPPHRHVIVTFPKKKFTPGERVLFQALLGSDPKREFLDARRLFHGVSAENTTCFFEPITEPTTPNV